MLSKSVILDYYVEGRWMNLPYQFIRIHCGTNRLNCHKSTNYTNWYSINSLVPKP